MCLNVTYFSASRCISSRFCLRNSLRRSKSKSSSMIHTELLGYTLKERKTEWGFIKIWAVPITLIQSQDTHCQLFGLERTRTTTFHFLDLFLRNNYQERQTMPHISLHHWFSPLMEILFQVSISFILNSHLLPHNIYTSF